MSFKKVTAIIRTDHLKCLEENLKRNSIRGITVSKVKGYGEYTNFFGKNWLSEHTKVEVFTANGKLDLVVSTIIDCAYTRGAGDGIVAVEPVESVYRIRTNRKISQAQNQPYSSQEMF